jgi:hypothetical protein
MAEEFANRASSELGHPEMSWYNGPPNGKTSGAEVAKSESDVTMQQSDAEGPRQAASKKWQEERDLDVADDDDRFMD